MKWTKAVNGYALMDGFHKRAVIIPNSPRKWNSYCRWTVDAIGLDRSTHCKTLAEAKALAEIAAR